MESKQWGGEVDTCVAIGRTGGGGRPPFPLVQVRGGCNPCIASIEVVLSKYVHAFECIISISRVS